MAAVGRTLGLRGGKEQIKMSKLTELTTEYKELGIQNQIDYNKLYLYSIITHSTAVEGSMIH